MTRCVICGRPPSEECCQKCHQVYDRLYGPEESA